MYGSKNLRPQTTFKVPEGELYLPEFYDTVKTLAQTVDVDYFIPGCPPVAEQTCMGMGVAGAIAAS